MTLLVPFGMRSSNGTQIFCCKSFTSLNRVLPWFNLADDGVRSINLSLFVNKWPKSNGPLASSWWILTCWWSGETRPGLIPKEVTPDSSAEMRLSWVTSVVSPWKGEGVSAGTSSGKVGQVASCPSLSFAVVQPGLHKGPQILRSCVTTKNCNLGHAIMEGHVQVCWNNRVSFIEGNVKLGVLLWGKSFPCCAP